MYEYVFKTGIQKLGLHVNNLHTCPSKMPINEPSPYKKHSAALTLYSHTITRTLTYTRHPLQLLNLAIQKTI